MEYKTKIEKLDTEEIVKSQYINWEYYRNSTILITGATGMIASQIVRSIIWANEIKGLNIKILALVRNKQKSKQIFDVIKTKELKYVVQDITEPIKIRDKVDYIIHTANGTSSKGFVEQPVETIGSIITGTKSILEFATKKRVKSVVYLSSMEVYGVTDYNSEEALKETDYGYIDILNVRNSYPEGKRLAECLCKSYAEEYNVPVKIARLAQTIGAGVDYNDNRVFAQFARSIVEKKDIVLKTKGESIRSYIYVTDAISAIFAMLERGENGECYNVANPDTTCSIKDMAEMLCNIYPESQLKIELDEKFYPTPSKLYLNSELLENLNWKPLVPLDKMYDRLIRSFYIIEVFNSDTPYNKHFEYNFWTNIFSLKNVLQTKVLTILGIHITFDLASLNKKYIAKVRKKKGIQKNKIIFTNYMGNPYGCNPKYITEELLRRNLDLDIVWMVRDYVSKESFPKGVRVIPYRNRKTLDELATAKVWVDNYHKVFYIRRGLTKTDEQVYIQTWHGSLGIKKIEKNVQCLMADSAWLDAAKKNSEMTDYWISNSDFETMVYKDSFWNVEGIKEFGHPRNDIFFKDTKAIEEKVRKYYNIEPDKKIALYVPSFREDEGLGYYTVEYNKIKTVLSEKFGSDWVFIVRLHPRLFMYSKFLLKDESQVIDATKYPDIQELLAVSDIMITDYSSCIFDYMLSRKPAFIYATDIEDYNTERGFYYPLESTPFPVSRNNEELAENIRNFDFEQYKKDVENFLKDKGCIDDGHAAERVADLIEGVMA